MILEVLVKTLTATAVLGGTDSLVARIDASCSLVPSSVVSTQTLHIGGSCVQQPLQSQLIRGNARHAQGMLSVCLDRMINAVHHCHPQLMECFQYMLKVNGARKKKSATD